MKSRVSQKFAKNIRECGYVFIADEDSEDNKYWTASDQDVVLRLKFCGRWTCTLEDDTLKETYTSHKYDNTKPAVEDCLEQAYQDALYKVTYYGKKLGKIA